MRGLVIFFAKVCIVVYLATQAFVNYDLVPSMRIQIDFSENVAVL